MIKNNKNPAIEKNGGNTYDIKRLRKWHIILGIAIMTVLFGGHIWNGITKVQAIAKAPQEVRILKVKQKGIINHLGTINYNVTKICEKLDIEPRKPIDPLIKDDD